MPDFPITQINESFPARKRAGDFIFFDNGARAQAPECVLDAVREHLLLRHVQLGALTRSRGR